MQELDSRDRFHINSAMGWLELGNPAEAELEIRQVQAAVAELPDILELRWAIHAKGAQWDCCLRVADSLLKADDTRASAWINRAYALRRVENGSIQKAFDALQPAADKFPDEITIPFNLACYTSLLGQLEEAKQWLVRALEIARKDKQLEGFEVMALSEPDLNPLWSFCSKKTFFPNRKER
jgi:tetratricopeptide (TPR) repeat protein